MNARRANPARNATADTVELAIAKGYVNPGWHPRDWAARLRQLALQCEEVQPGRAVELRAWAEAVERRHMGVTANPNRGGSDR